MWHFRFCTCWINLSVSTVTNILSIGEYAMTFRFLNSFWLHRQKKTAGCVCDCRTCFRNHLRVTEFSGFQCDLAIFGTTAFKFQNPFAICAFAILRNIPSNRAMITGSDFDCSIWRVSCWKTGQQAHCCNTGRSHQVWGQFPFRCLLKW